MLAVSTGSRPFTTAMVAALVGFLAVASCSSGGPKPSAAKAKVDSMVEVSLKASGLQGVKGDVERGWSLCEDLGPKDRQKYDWSIYYPQFSAMSGPEVEKGRKYVMAIRDYWTQRAKHPGANLDVKESTVPNGLAGDVIVRTDGYYTRASFPLTTVGASSPCLTRSGPHRP